MAGASIYKPRFFTQLFTRFFTQQYWAKWFRVAKSSNNIATLGPRQIYIIPTRWGILFAIMLLLLLIGSINYSISLGYYVTFLLASLGHTAMLHTWRNLVHLQITLLPTEPVFAGVSSKVPVFAGNTAQVQIHIADTKIRARTAIAAQFENNALATNDIASNASALFLVPLPTQQRGWQTLPRIRLHTEFPLSLFHAWAYVDNTQQIMVYAKPSENNSLPPMLNDAQASGKTHIARGDEDFDGHKNYQIGDAPSRIDWKASSRGIGMFSKQYSGSGASTIWLDWEATKGLDVEARISQLTKWVIDAHAAQQHFGLKLPNLTLAPNHSQMHYHAALQALALL
jgi:uncharacterized protein (DUF58 family)